MEAIIFIGLQGAGKTTFYRERYGQSHVHISLDLLNTRNRERLRIEECVAERQPIVVDNTNPSRAERASYIAAAKAAGYRVIGYYFQSRVEDCHRRNAQRAGKQIIPFAGLLGTAKRLQLPNYTEGFDELRYVRIDSEGAFVVEDWKDEV